MPTENNKVKEIAHKVLEKANIPDDQKFGSVIAILMMVSIILTLMRVIQECNKAKTNDMSYQEKTSLYAQEIRSYSKKRGWFTRLRIKRILKRELPKEDFNKYAIKLTEILMDSGEQITDDEALTLVEAANV